MSENYSLVSRKISISELDKEITDKGFYKIQKDSNNMKVFIGEGIYDKKLFKDARKEQKVGKIFERSEGSNFYIKLNAPSPSLLSDYSLFEKQKKIIQEILEYEKVLYKGEIVLFQSLEKEIKVNDINDNDFYYGEEAALMFLSETIKSKKRMKKEKKDELFYSYINWMNKNNIREFLISDISLREPKVIGSKDKPIPGEINTLYESLFDVNSSNRLFLEEDFEDMIDYSSIYGEDYSFIEDLDSSEKDFFDDISFETLKKEEEEVKNDEKVFPKIAKYLCSKRIFEAKKNVENSLLSYLREGKKSVVKKEGISKKLGGAVRGTIVPNPFIPEDCIEIGTAFGDSLYPEFIGLWKTSEELNWLLSRGVLELDKEIFRYEADWIEEEVMEYYRTTEGKEWRYEIMNYFYPWFEDKYKFIPENKIEEIKKSINNKRMEFYKNHKSDVKYVVLSNRPPTICQLSTLAMFPIFRDSIGINGLNNEDCQMLTGITSPYKKESFYSNSNFCFEDDDYDNASSKENEINEDLIENLDPENEAQFRDFESESNEFFLDWASDLDMENLQNVYPEDAIAINPLICSGKNADFDGDLFLVAGLYTKAANLEALNLMSSKNYKTVSDGCLRNDIPKEFIEAMENIYKKDEKLALEISKIINS